ncbi:hypothetical protein PSR1_04451 [Anaeromyxobacter sp. PSR-1]|nr:hypothetical protein PSR1_04451 [Anaeromyxobacter sp. PSR-1]
MRPLLRQVLHVARGLAGEQERRERADLDRRQAARHQPHAPLAQQRAPAHVEDRADQELRLALLRAAHRQQAIDAEPGAGAHDAVAARLRRERQPGAGVHAQRIRQREVQHHAPVLRLEVHGEARHPQRARPAADAVAPRRQRQRDGRRAHGAAVHVDRAGPSLRGDVQAPPGQRAHPRLHLLEAAAEAGRVLVRIRLQRRVGAGEREEGALHLALLPQAERGVGEPEHGALPLKVRLLPLGQRLQVVHDGAQRADRAVELAVLVDRQRAAVGAIQLGERRVRALAEQPPPHGGHLLHAADAVAARGAELVRELGELRVGPGRRVGHRHHPEPLHRAGAGGGQRAQGRDERAPHGSAPALPVLRGSWNALGHGAARSSCPSTMTA